MIKHADKNLTEGPILRGIISYTVPILFTNLLQLLYGAADLIVVGQFCGSLSVGAIGATGSITSLIINLFIGLSVGVSTSVSTAYGRRDKDSVCKAVHTALPLALVCGAILTAIGVAFAVPLLSIMRTPSNVLTLSALYMRIYFCGMIFTLLYNFSAAILCALGDTKTPLAALGISGAVNILFNIVLVALFKMNVDGVAYATVASQALSAAIVIISLAKRNDEAKLVAKKIRFYGESLKKIIMIGVPAGINSSLFAITNVIIQSSINSLGEAVVIGSAGSENIEAFIAVSLNSFNSAALNYTAQNFGAGNFKRIKKSFACVCLCVTVFGAILAAFATLFAPRLVGLYITDSPEAFEIGVYKLCLLAFGYILSGLMNVSMSALQGFESALPPMLIGVLGICGIRITWVYTVFRAFHGAEALFISYPISWAVTFLCQAAAFYIVYKKKCKKGAAK